jgi:hypothetical protein
MNILDHSESDILKLSDRWVWQIYPGDIELTLGRYQPPSCSFLKSTITLLRIG